ncbi:putative glutathione S-transferase [Silene latifolia]|uniref:putative glutathione S-transferase n=1 Tax=Silene latifolia TaxID=37657 RepID=UPI003D76F71A
MGEVKVHRMWRSPFSWRVELALKLKGIDFEIIDEDLKNKSDLLIKYNPVHKKVPVLVHDGKPVVESLVILEYIDETWKENSLLPTDPYERAQARFWASFIDDKIFPAARKAIMSRGEDVEKAQEEFDSALKIFEKEIEGKGLFGGSKIGYLDIAALLVCFWIPVFQEAVGKDVLTREKFPTFYAWSDGLLGHPFMKENLPNREEFVASYRARFAPST